MLSLQVLAELSVGLARTCCGRTLSTTFTVIQPLCMELDVDIAGKACKSRQNVLPTLARRKAGKMKRSHDQLLLNLERCQCHLGFWVDSSQR